MTDNDQDAHDFYSDPANLAVTGSGQKRERPRKSAMISVRFDPAVIDAVKALARDGQTVGAWIRRAVQAELDRTRLEPAGRKFHSRSLTVTGSPGPVFGCVHMTVANVSGASCVQCGPLAAIA